MRKSAKGKILEATSKVIADKGVLNLTLEEVARVAEVSKGGLLYHFPSKDALILALLDQSLEAFTSGIEKKAQEDDRPGAWIRAYIECSFGLSEDAVQGSKSASAIIAGSSYNPHFLQGYVETQKVWKVKILKDGLPQNIANTIRMAVDGIWLNEAIGLTPLNRQEREAQINYLMSLSFIDDK